MTCSTNFQNFNDFKNNYEFRKYLGEGSFGEVIEYRLKDSVSEQVKLTLPDVAVVKSFKHSSLSIDTLREISTLRALNHDNIVKYMATIIKTSDCDPAIILETMQSNLNTYIQTYTNMNFKCLKVVYEKLANGVSYMHSCGFMHRDLKPSNVLCTDKKIIASDPRFQLKVADMGLACKITFGRSYTMNVQTLWWRSPEILFGKSSYDHKIDYWSVGFILLEMLVGYIYFRQNIIKYANSSRDMIRNVCELRGTPDETTWKGVSTFKNYYKLPKISNRDLNDYIQLQLKKFNDDEGISLNNTLTSLLTYDTNLRSMPIGLAKPLSTTYTVPSYDGQVDFNKTTRTSLFNWIVRVALEKFKLNFCTLLFTFELVDRYANLSKIKTEKFHMIGCACMILSSRILEQAPSYSYSDYEFISSGVFTKDDLEQVTCDVAKCLDYDLYATSSPYDIFVFLVDDNGSLMPSMNFIIRSLMYFIMYKESSLLTQDKTKMLNAIKTFTIASLEETDHFQKTTGRDDFGFKVSYTYFSKTYCSMENLSKYGGLDKLKSDIETCIANSLVQLNVVPVQVQMAVPVQMSEKGVPVQMAVPVVPTIVESKSDQYAKRFPQKAALVTKFVNYLEDCNKFGGSAIKDRYDEVPQHIRDKYPLMTRNSETGYKYITKPSNLNCYLLTMSKQRRYFADVKFAALMASMISSGISYEDALTILSKNK